MDNIKYLSLKDIGAFTLVILFILILFTNNDGVVMEKCQKTQSFETCLHTLRR